ncbi:MAG: dTDP-4-dehydrorhamnose 3,5-epimerase [Candidatus Daviesbacteria bacterium]|nr:dTDP-4-dehydrorhamnose 3,5-epimerase [Candidatus Daviesbacteria bacterium]
MDNQIIKDTPLEGVFVIDRPNFSDERGFFKETFRKSELEEKLGYEFVPVQQNHSRSVRGVLRGIHVAPWSKLVYCVNGTVQEVVVDLRPKSSTYGKSFSIVLGEEKKACLYLPPFCGNAFLTLSETADYAYLVTDYWAPGKEFGVAWNDPDLSINWQISAPILSEKDQQNPRFREIKV